ncbi:MAG TPA: penicillin-binding protein 2 [Stellaceae bacterium]|nr:penicillin-binding protein 2 [Stellaceae bacterium]
MNRDKEKSKLLTRRALLMGGAQGVVLAAIAGRLYYLQVVEAAQYETLSDENRIGIRLIAPRRGLILDRFGVKLADNRPTYRAVLVPEQVRNIGATLDAVATLVPLSDADRRRVLRDARHRHSFVPVSIREDLSWDEMARIEVNTLELPGVSIEQDMTRQYPFGATASGFLGYVAAVSEQELNGDPVLELPDFRIGKSGIEKQYDLDLRGLAGTKEVEVNAYGRVVRELDREDGHPGTDAVLAIDMAMQDFVARRCAEQQSAAAVLMDAWTGEVLALVSVPGYDPAGFVNGVSEAQWQTWQTDPYRPLVNKAISGTYAPGSTFKPVVALAALHAGAITPQTRITCPGVYQLGNAEFHCWKHSGHGPLVLRDAIKHSCDVFFFETAHRTGIDHIAAMARRFGFGDTVGIDVPGEAKGLIPDTEWKLATTGIRWQQGETVSAGIGQSYDAATPLQLCVMAARLVTNRAVVPRLLRQGGIVKADTVANLAVSDDLFKPMALPAKHLALVLDGMKAVVNEPGGTAYAERITDDGMAMGGKSGTSQVRHISAAEREHGVRKALEVPWKERDHALFIAFAPVGSPRYVCATVVEHGGVTGGGGSAVAAPICRDILLEAQRRDPARRVPDRLFTVADASAGG